MSHHHHAGETTLLAYASGSLPTAHRQVVALHLAFCPVCARDVRLFEQAGGALLDALAPAPLADDSLDRVLARLDQPAPASSPAAPPLASPAEALATLAKGRWRWSGPGIAMMPLMARDESDTRLDLIRVAPGTGLLQHGHGGFETTVVLQGAFDDGLDRYGVGDFAEAQDGLNHAPEALPGPDCICLIATTARLKPNSLLGWLVGPLLGM
jgi:putative transcriptional regulator